MNRKRVILAALLGVLSLCLLYAYYATPRLEKAPPRAEKPRARAERVPRELQTKDAEERINFDFLTHEPQDFPGAKRDIFSFGKQPPVRVEEPVAKIEAPVIPVETVESIVVEPEPPMVPLAVVQKSLGKFTFLGFLEKEGVKTVFLSSGGNIFLVKRGETFGPEQEFQVDAIDGNLLKVRHSGRDDLVEIPLIEQQKLNASASSPARIEPAEALPSQSDARIFTPKRRTVRPDSEKIDNPFQKMIEKNSPAEEQNAEFPLNGDVLEEEVNGTNQ